MKRVLLSALLPLALTLTLGVSGVLAKGHPDTIQVDVGAKRYTVSFNTLPSDGSAPPPAIVVFFPDGSYVHPPTGGPER